MIDRKQTLVDRLARPEQVDDEESLGSLPPYVDAFLSHLRLLVGVPFTYLVPDARLLPDHAIRFFYLDRGWTDRLVDGAAAVGKLGTRELAHHQAHAGALLRALDSGERLVRLAQRRRLPGWDGKREEVEAEVVTGFLLRSGLVSGWPHMEVRASAAGRALKLARLERLSPGVMIALFFGVPDHVELEEPHHGVQFGVSVAGRGWRIWLRKPDGERLTRGDDLALEVVGSTDGNRVGVQVPIRAGGKRVVHVSRLRAALHAAQKTHPSAMPQSGSAAFALTALDPPWRQPFGPVDTTTETGAALSDRVVSEALRVALAEWVKR